MFSFYLSQSLRALQVGHACSWLRDTTYGIDSHRMTTQRQRDESVRKLPCKLIAVSSFNSSFLLVLQYSTTHKSPEEGGLHGIRSNYILRVYTTAAAADAAAAVLPLATVAVPSLVTVLSLKFGCVEATLSRCCCSTLSMLGGKIQNSWRRRG